MGNINDRITAFELEHSNEIGDFFEYAQDEERIQKIIETEEKLN